MEPSNRFQEILKRGFYSPSFFCTALVFICIIVLFYPTNSTAKVSFSESFLAKIEKAYGDYASKRLKGWQKLIEDNQGKSEKQALKIVNEYFNLMKFESDLSHWGEKDYWATPVEFLVSGGGDCEDFSISKYFTLIELGVPDEKLLITYVKAIEINEAHMVLTYYESPESVPVVLDNLIGEIKPATERKDLVPVYSFNGAGLWQAKQRGLGRKIGKSEDLSRWDSMLERMEEGTIKEFR